MARSRRGLPIVTGDQEPLVSAFLGKDFNEILPSSTHDSSIHIASGNARQINGPVTTTFTGPIDKVEAHFAETPQTSLERKLLEWLRPPSQSRHHKEVYKTHAVDTSRWFLDGEEFKSWLDGSTPLLWINGAVGSGKTVLFSSILENVRMRKLPNAFEGKTSEELACIVCYHYFSFQDSSRSQFDTCLRATIAMLCSQSKNFGLLEGIFMECHGESITEEPSIDALQDLLLQLLSNLATSNEIFLLFDALDEVDGAEQEEMLVCLLSMEDLHLPQLHILVTSRSEPIIRESLKCAEGWRSMLLTKETINQDVELCVKNTLGTHYRLSRCADETKELIMTTLTGESKGMFRWVALQLESLKRLNVMSHNTIERALANLPKDLEATYSRILSQIDRVLAYEAAMALKWIACSARLLYVEELIDACIITPDELPCVNPKHRLDPFSLQDMLYGLIVIDPPLEASCEASGRFHKVSLSHFSVQEYLVGQALGKSSLKEFGFDKKQVAPLLATACLSYLYDFNTQVCRKDLYPFLSYAWYHWDQHVQPSPEDERSPIRKNARKLYQRLTTNCSAFAHFLGRPHSRGDQRRLICALDTPYFRPDFDLYIQPASGKGEENDLPLTTGEGGFRLLKILPSLQQANTPRCRLYQANLNDEPSYDALSWVWGPGDERQILLNGKSMSTRANVVSFLENWQYHSEDAGNDLWVDILCINQNDVEERRTQVMQMGKIFEHTRELMVWMGPLSATAAVGVDLLRKLASWVHVFQGKRTTSQSQDLHELLHHAEGHCNVWACIRDVLDHNWWQRVWTVPESTLPTNARITFDSTSLYFNNLEAIMSNTRAIQAYLDTDKTLGDGFRRLRGTRGWKASQVRCLTRAEFQRGYRFTLLELISRFSTLKVTQPCDKIYAFLGLLPSDDLRLRFQPDYSLPFGEFCLSTAYKILIAYRNLDLLSYCSSCSARLRELPSWVPDFESEMDVIPLATISFKSRPPSVDFEIDPKTAILTLKGVVIGSVSATSRRYTSFAEFWSSEDKFQTIEDQLGLTRFKKHDFGMRRLMWNSMTAGQAQDLYLPEIQANNANIILPSQQNVINITDILAEIERREVPNFLRNRCVAVCGTTLVLAPATTRIGDYIVAIQGFAATVTLRRIKRSSDTRASAPDSEKHDACYSFIGESYIHDLQIDDHVEENKTKLESFPLI